MAEANDARVAVYLDFDNIVISWYDRVHGRNAYGKDRQRITENPTDPEVTERLSRAMIEVGASSTTRRPSAHSCSRVPTPTGRRR